VKPTTLSSHLAIAGLVFLPTEGFSESSPLVINPETSFAGRMFPTHENAISGDYVFLDSAGEGTLTGTGQGSGYGVSLSTLRGNAYVSFVGKVRFSYHSGTSEKTVNEEALSLPFRLFGGEASIGARIHLLPGQTKGIRPYLGTAYVIGLQHLRLSDLPESQTDLYTYSSGLVMGLDTFVGIDIKETLFAEFSLRGGSGSLGGFTTLSISSAVCSFGYRW